MKRYFCFLMLVIASSSSYAGWLVGGQEGVHAGSATIKRFTNNYYNTGNFAVEVEGGFGPCANAMWIVFDQNNMPSTAFEHGFEIAKAAFTEGHKVNIYSYDGDDCTNAQYIEVVRH